jgi:predicted transcriptional regulator
MAAPLGKPNFVATDEEESNVDEERFNLELRKFLKQVGINSQREIETAVREAIARGDITGNERLRARMELVIDAVSLKTVVEGEIALG